MENREIFRKNPEKMDRKILMVKTEKKYVGTLLPDLKNIFLPNQLTKFENIFKSGILSFIGQQMHPHETVQNQTKLQIWAVR